MSSEPASSDSASVSSVLPSDATSDPLLPSQVLGVPPLPPPIDPDKPLEAYFDSARNQYLFQNAGGRWLSHTESSLRRILRSHGYSPCLRKFEQDAGETLSEVDREILRIQDEHDVRYCGPLAGREAGFHCENGVRFLVTDSAELIAPARGEFPLIRAIVRSLVTGGGAEQEPYGSMQLPLILGWFAMAVQSLYGRSPRPHQALVLAGPAGCGKSVMQNHLITPLLGGRSAKCAPYLQGRTSFNSELFGAEHLMLEDESSDTCIRARLALASNIKQICVNEVQPCHAKNRTIVNLMPFWRLSISLNDEPERLLIIPPLAGDVADKLIILRCHPVQWPAPVGGSGQWVELMAAVKRELPAFLHFLLQYEVNPALHEDRYGVQPWCHPELAAAIEEMSPEAHLALLIERWMDGPAWRGTADQLRTALLDSPETQRDARDLLRWPNACGTYLCRLVKSPRPPLGVQAHRKLDRRDWILTLPES